MIDTLSPQLEITKKKNKVLFTIAYDDKHKQKFKMSKRDFEEFMKFEGNFKKREIFDWRKRYFTADTKDTITHISIMKVDNCYHPEQARCSVYTSQLKEYIK